MKAYNTGYDMCLSMWAISSLLWTLLAYHKQATACGERKLRQSSHE
jgi:hypothetical protein